MNIFTRMLVNKRDVYGRTPIWWAAFKGDIGKVRALIAAGAKPSIQDKEEGKTPLMEAAFYGHLDVVKALIAAGAELNAEDKDGKSAMLLAANHGHSEIVMALVAAGADVRATSGRGTVLMETLDWCSVDCTMAVLAAGASARDCDNHNIVVLTSAIGGRGHPDLVKALIDAGADVNAKYKTDGASIFMRAAQYDVANIQTLKILIAAGADVNETDNDGSTALTQKFATKEPEIVALIRVAEKARRGY